MIDLHTHILNNIDDGSNSLSESIEILKKSIESGYDIVCCTPHFYSYKHNLFKLKAQVDAKFKTLVEECNCQNIKVKLILGAEVYIDENFIVSELLKNLTINQSRYILIELPMTRNWDSKIFNVINEILALGLVPIIAHIERYKHIKKYPNDIAKLINSGCLIQFDLFSIDNQKLLHFHQYMLANDMVHCLGSDVHKADNCRAGYKELLYKIKNIAPLEKFENYMRKIVNNESIKLSKLNMYIKKTLFGKYKLR